MREPPRNPSLAVIVTMAAVLAIVLAIIAAVMALVTPSPASGTAEPFTVTSEGLTLNGRTFVDGGHVNVRTQEGTTYGVHFDAKCRDRTDAECAGAPHQLAQYIGTAYLPWSVVGVPRTGCIVWVQLDGENYHYGEHGEPPVCCDHETPPPSTSPPSSEPPTTAPPTTAPPSTEPPSSTPPTSAPPTTEPPTSAPPTSAPPTSSPPTTAPPTPTPPGPTPPPPAPVPPSRECIDENTIRVTHTDGTTTYVADRGVCDHRDAPPIREEGF